MKIIQRILVLLRTFLLHLQTEKDNLWMNIQLPMVFVCVKFSTQEYMSFCLSICEVENLEIYGAVLQSLKSKSVVLWDSSCSNELGLILILQSSYNSQALPILICQMPFSVIWCYQMSEFPAVISSIDHLSLAVNIALLMQLVCPLNSWMSAEGLGKEAEHVLNSPERLGHSCRIKCLKESE